MPAESTLGGREEEEREDDGQVWDLLTTHHLDQLHKRMSSGLTQAPGSSIGLRSRLCFVSHTLPCVCTLLPLILHKVLPRPKQRD